MSRYRETMTDLYRQVQENAGDYLKSKMTDTQINNIKKTWSMKTAKDVTPAIRDMIKKMDIPTQLAIKHAKINQLSKLVEEQELAEFNDAQIAKLKKEYEPMRGKTISVTNANKLGSMFTKFDSNKNALEKLYGGDIPFISTMAMTRLMTKHGYKAADLNKLRKEELDLLEEAELLGEGTGTIKGFRNDKEKSNMISLAKQHSLKVKEVAGGIELSGNMRAILDMQLAAQGNGLKAEEVAEGRMSEIDAMVKAGKSAAEIAKELKLNVRDVKAILGEELTEEEDAGKLKAELEDKEKEIAMLKQKAETEKAKAIKGGTEKLTNPETGEPLLQVGIAYKHMKDKMAKEKAAEDDRKEKKSADMKDRVSKLKDKLKESINLDESDASDKAKGMGLTYMKFGRYGKDGKVTHKSIGGNLTAVDKDGKPKDEPKDEPKSTGDKDVDDVNKSLAKARADKKASEPKKEPEPKPKLDPFDAQKDLEKEVSDGMIDVEDDGEGGLSMSKEYEPSQDYEAERDSIAIKDYLMDKGIDEDDIYIDVEGSEDDEYLQINVQVRAPKEEPKEKDFSTKQIKQAYGIANDPRYKQGNYSGAVKTINKIAPGLANHPDVQKVLKRTNEDVECSKCKGEGCDDCGNMTETHVGQTKKANQSQKDAKGEKEIIKSIRETILDMWQEAAGEKKEKEVEEEEVKKEEPKKDEDKSKAELEKKNDEVTLLKQKIDLEKSKAVQKDTQKMVNPETGEPLLQVGIAYKALKDKMKKEETEPTKEKKVSETELKNKKRTDTENKPSEIEPNPTIKYTQ